MNFDDPIGPIQHYSWAKFVVQGEEHSKTLHGSTGKGKDILLVGTKVKKWKKRKGHVLTEEMIEVVYDYNIDILIIGIGADGKIECSVSLINSIKRHGIDEVILKKTKEACQAYNLFYHQGKKVALLAHGTC
ncbi:MAG: hypothetical protein JXJ22_14445 [Bacteroidales bacterium]|nr:hypothetical protein [Bacteroidales bacterium]